MGPKENQSVILFLFDELKIKIPGMGSFKRGPLGPHRRMKKPVVACLWLQYIYTKGIARSRYYVHNMYIRKRHRLNVYIIIYVQHGTGVDRIVLGGASQFTIFTG